LGVLGKFELRIACAAAETSRRDFEPKYRALSLQAGLCIVILSSSYHPHQKPLMEDVEILTTTVSSKGQVILPKAIRDRRNWQAGTCLVVEDTPDGVLLKATPPFAPTRPEDVASAQI
jgi:AbrB family looped-hinge helix DNA binding protein